MRATEAGAVLMIACSETDSNMYYASGFLAPDPFIYLQAQGRSMLLMSDLEVDRARAQSKVDEVLSYSEYESRAKSKGIEKPETVDVVDLLLNEKGAKELTVPGNFPLEYGDALRAKGFRLAIKREPFFERRAVKTVQEVEAIRKAQIAVEESVDEAFDLLLKA